MDPSYNNSFGTQPNLPSQPIISSGSGDIVLPSTPKKSKKPLIITLIIILLSALLGFGAWWYLTQLQDSNSSGQSSVETTVKQAFNIYANHIIYGNKKSTQNFDLNDILENYDLEKPNIYIEAANLNEVEAAEEDFATFSELYGMPATTEDLSDYFYDYEKSKLLGNLDLEDDEVLELRENAMITFAEIYYGIYDIDTKVQSEAAK